MRRISLALALAGAVASGCGGSVSGTGGDSGKGAAEGTYKVTIQNGQNGNTVLRIKGGNVVSSPAGINCGVGVVGTEVCEFSFPANSTVTLTATAYGTDGGTPAKAYAFRGWAGDCGGEGACTLSGTSDKYVLASFSTDVTGHANWSNGTVHGPKYFDFARRVSGALDCQSCHGADLKGLGIAVGCDDCHAWPVHGGATPIPALAKDFTSGPEVTAECIKCHPGKADEVLGSMHFTWLGRSTSVGQTGIGKRNLINNFCVAVPSNEARCLQCHPSYSKAPVKDPATGSPALNTGPMYLWSTNAAVDKTRIDCLICHADLNASKYSKAAAPLPASPAVPASGTFGGPVVASDAQCFPACAANQICSSKDTAGNPWSDGKNYCRAATAADSLAALKAAAGTVGKTDRTNCGYCHSYAGGGDNVKMGDLGSALTKATPPAPSTDVHLGSSASYAPQTCSKCHNATQHDLRGTGLTIPVDEEGRLTCTDCHSGLHPAHPADEITPHLAFVACQTCHIPAFSRSQFTKVSWDWRTAGDKQACQGLNGCVGFGTVTYPSGNAQTGVVAGVGGEAPKNLNPASAPAGLEAAEVELGYDWKKGISIYAKDVVPAYRWIPPQGGQQGTHETSKKDGLLGLGTEAEPYRLSDVLDAPPDPKAAGWKIAPFKVMKGRSPAFADKSAMIVPHVFGPDGLWQTTLGGAPVFPNNLGSVANPWMEATVDGIWTGVLNYGAAVAGQLGAPVAKAQGTKLVRAGNVVTVTTVDPLPDPLPATLYLVGAEASFPSGAKTVTATGANTFTYPETGADAASTAFVAFYQALTTSDWFWASTVMYINLNHEVAPATDALTCADCHTGAPATGRMKELFPAGLPAQP